MFLRGKGRDRVVTSNLDCVDRSEAIQIHLVSREGNSILFVGFVRPEPAINSQRGLVME